MFTRAALLATFLVASSAAAPSPSAAAPLGLTGNVLGPATAQTYFSSGAAPVGDVNADGLGDVAVRSGSAVVVLLGTTGTGLSGTPAGDRSFAITYGALSDQGDARPAGDVDGDGYDDILVPTSSRAYVVYGAASLANVDLATASSRVTAVESGAVSGVAGPAGAGDFDGDGNDDLVVRAGTGAAIVRGGPRVASLSATVAGPRRVAITGIRTCGFKNVFFYECNTTLQTPEPVGDLNGDGKDDLYFNERNFVALGRAGTTALAGTGPDSRAFSTRGVGGVPQIGRPHSFGDITGDGIDDLVARPGSADRIWHVIPGRAGTTGTLDAAGPGVLNLPTPATDSPLWVLPAGDPGSDGRADVAFAYAGQVRLVNGRPGPATVAVDALAPLGLPIGDLRDDFGYPGSVSLAGEGAGDLDGDGAADMVVTSPWSDTDGLLNRGVLFVLTHGADRLAPSLYPRGTTNPELGSNLVPSVFAAAPTGPGTSIRVHLLEPASVELRIRSAAGAVLSTETRAALPAGVTSIPWDGRTRGVNGVAGKYTLELVAVDAAGNRSAVQSVPFEITGSAAEGPPTLQVTRREVVPAGARILPPANVYPYGDPLYRRVQGACPDADSVTSLALTETPREVVLNDPRAGESCALYYQPPPAQDNDGYPPLPTSAASYPWHTTVSINGGAAVEVTAPAPGEYYVRIPAFGLRNGVNTIAIVDRWDDSGIQTTDTDVTNTLAWSFPGSGGGVANSASGNPATAAGLQLTAATANQTGVAVACPANFSLGAMTVEFDAEITGGSGAGHGLAFTVFDRRPATVLASGANVGLGWVGYVGTAFALVTAKERYNPAQNFVGIASGVPGKSGYPTWLASAIPGRSIAGATTRVKIEVAAGVATVTLDGNEMLRRAVSFPAGACLGFTAATGTRTQRHAIKNLRVRSS